MHIKNKSTYCLVRKMAGIDCVILLTIGECCVMSNFIRVNLMMVSAYKELMLVPSFYISI